MTIDFSRIPEEFLPNFKGGEGALQKRAYADGHVTIMLDRLAPGSSIGVHTHREESEIIYIVSGVATFLFEGKEETVSAGACHYCPLGYTHSLKNNGTEDLIFFAVLPKQ